MWTVGMETGGGALACRLACLSSLRVHLHFKRGKFLFLLYGWVMNESECVLLKLKKIFYETIKKHKNI